jgi:hypothetical protein
MTPLRLNLALAALLAAGATSAADLAKIDRTISKEPAYKNKPKYCLLLFGPEAKTRVWLVQDGEVLYVDRNANADLTEAGERVTLKQSDTNFRVFEAVDVRHGGLTHTGLTVAQLHLSPESVGNDREFRRIQGANPGAWIWTVAVAAERSGDDVRKLPRRIEYIANGDGLGYLLFADRPQDAPVIHFNGPWALGLQDVKQHLTIGHKSQLQIGVGTQGIGPGTFSFLMYPDTIPVDAYPVADITFPPKAPGQKSIRQKYTLKDRC